MKTGERWSSWKSRSASCLLATALLVHAPGCAQDRSAIEANLKAQTPDVIDDAALAQYRAGCPDILELAVRSRPEFSATYEIDADGCVNLHDYGRLRVEGHTLAEITQGLAAEIGVGPEDVTVRVAGFRSRQLLLFGEVIGWQRSVPYRGPETVPEVLRRVGGITPGAEPRDVYVVRPNLGEAKRPEVFHIDLSAIVMKSDQRTNIRLLPFDQIYVGETRRAQIEKAIPGFLRFAVPSATEK